MIQRRKVDEVDEIAFLLARQVLGMLHSEEEGFVAIGSEQVCESQRVSLRTAAPIQKRIADEDSHQRSIDKGTRAGMRSALGAGPISTGHRCVARARAYTWDYISGPTNLDSFRGPDKWKLS